MARFERNFRGSAEAPLTLEELISLLGDQDDSRTREDAIACYLSGSEGWRDAMKLLGGAFAEDASGLKGQKAD